MASVFGFDGYEDAARGGLVAFSQQQARFNISEAPNMQETDMQGTDMQGAGHSASDGWFAGMPCSACGTCYGTRYGTS